MITFYFISFIAKFLSVLSFDIFRIRRSIILQNLDIVFANTKTLKEKKQIGRRSMTSFFSTLLEFIVAKRLFPKAKINFINKQLADTIFKQNTGAYAMCIHMSNWELLCHINAKTYTPVHVVVKNIGKGFVAKWVENVRKHIGYSLIDRQGHLSATTQIFNAIDKKEIVGFIVDQKRPSGEHLPFFGKLASTNNSLAKLYLRKKAPIVPVIIKRTKPGCYDVIYFPQFLIEEDNSIEFAQLVTENTKRMNLQVEQMILQNPQEYFWMHNRWDLKK
ncbi:MAG: lysophospholipid acyltransferase family protein [Bdellovibrionota bacterium]